MSPQLIIKNCTEYHHPWFH